MTNFIKQVTEFSRDFELDSCARDVLLAKAMSFLEEECAETRDAIELGDDAEILDGAGDVAFIALNMIYKWGRMHLGDHDEATMLISQVMDRICEANLAKRWPDGEVKRNEFGKVVKPDGWKPPTYDDIVGVDV